MAAVHSYYITIFGRNGGNNQGGMGIGTSSYPNNMTKGQSYEDGVWGTAGCPNASFQNGSIAFCYGMAVPDVVGHEYAHGVTYFTFNQSGMVYYGESGAVEESFCDVMGETLEKFATGTTDWVSCTNCSGLQKSLIDPPSSPEDPGWPSYPDKLYASGYLCVGRDQGGVHHNSTVSSKAFYLMSEGGYFNGCSVNPIGINKVEQILYRAMTVYYTQSESFNAAYVHIKQAAADLYGPDDCAQVEKALQAVELDQPGLCSGIPEIPPAADTRPVVGINGRAIRDTIARTASANYRFLVWGKVTPVDQYSFTLDDGSGPVKVISPGFTGIASGDNVTVTGNLDTSFPAPTLRARPENVKLEAAGPLHTSGMALASKAIAPPTAPQAARATVVLGPNPKINYWSPPSLTEKSSWPQLPVQRPAPQAKPQPAPPTGPIMQIAPPASDCGCRK